MTNPERVFAILMLGGLLALFIGLTEFEATGLKTAVGPYFVRVEWREAVMRLHDYTQDVPAIFIDNSRRWKLWLRVGRMSNSSVVMYDLIDWTSNQPRVLVKQPGQPPPLIRNGEWQTYQGPADCGIVLGSTGVFDGTAEYLKTKELP